MIDIKRALLRSGTELDLEDRIVTWQRGAQPETARGRQGTGKDGPLPAPDYYLRRSDSSPALLPIVTALRSPSTLRRESAGRPLTEANLSASQLAFGSSQGPDRNERRGSLRVLKKVGKVVTKPIIVPGRGILRFQRKWESIFWSAVEGQVDKQKARRVSSSGRLRARPRSPSVYAQEDLNTIEPTKNTIASAASRTQEVLQSHTEDDSEDDDAEFVDQPERGSSRSTIHLPQLEAPALGAKFSEKVAAEIPLRVSQDR